VLPIDPTRAVAAVETDSAAQGKTASPKLQDAARQFEALLITQLLRAARGDSEGWLGAGEDHSAASAMEMAEEQFAAALSQQGGLGLARMITSGLKSE
jgi:Rod binding domain-containing protein